MDAPDDELANLREQLQYSDLMRGKLAQGCSELSKDLVLVIEKCQQLQEVVDAAINWRRAWDALTGKQEFVSLAFVQDGLIKAVDAHLERVRRRS